MAFTTEDRNSIRIRNNVIYQHATVRINYTTYDIRRDYDTINPQTHPFVMVLSPETHHNAHPFWYAAVLGIFHAEVQYMGLHPSDLRPKHTEFLWVKWLEPVYAYAHGRKNANLPKLGFVPDSDEFSIGFLDPSLILRGCHLMPAFSDGRIANFSALRSSPEARTGFFYDWKHYYVGM
jgi:hypothetical protein